MPSQTPNLAALLEAVATDVVTKERKIPSPGPGEVLIRNHAIAMNPVDWKRQLWGAYIASYPVILGSDVAGIVAKIGSSVTTFALGHRVLGYCNSFVTGDDDHSAFQTYTIVRTGATTKIPGAMSFTQAATLPQAVGTATFALFDVLGVPRPVREKYSEATISSSPHSILVWGAAGSVGFITVQIARLVGLTVFATASKRHHAKLRSIGVTEVVDYNSPTAVEDLLAAAKRAGTQITYAVDAVSVPETLAPVMEVLSRGTRTRKLAYMLPWPENVRRVDDIEVIHIAGDEIIDRRDDLCTWVFNKALLKWLEEGVIEPIRVQVVEGGISGIQNAINTLKQGVHGEKVVVEV